MKRRQFIAGLGSAALGVKSAAWAQQAERVRRIGILNAGEALDSPDFDKRGAVTDEWIAIFKQLWTQSPASFSGQFYSYADIRAEPFPLQKPHPDRSE